MSDGRRRLNITSEMVRTAMNIKGLGFVEAVKWLTMQYPRAFTPEYQQTVYEKAMAYKARFLKAIEPLPPWLTKAQVEDEMHEFFLAPIRSWYQGRGCTPAPHIAYYTHAIHAYDHFARWAAQRPRALRSPLPELKGGEEPAVYLDDSDIPRETALDDLPEPIRLYAQLRASGRTQKESGRILGLSRREINKMEKWTRRFLQGTYNDARCRMELERGVGKPLGTKKQKPLED